jgi:hypothetical protein
MTLRTCVLALLLALPLGLTGCKDDSVGDKIDEAGNDAKRAVEDAVD